MHSTDRRTDTFARALRCGQTLILAVALLGAAAGAAPDPAPSVWIENGEVGVVCRPIDEQGGSQNELRGEVFDSPDYQLLLLLHREWPQAFVIDLAGGDVLAYPTPQILADDGRMQAPDTAAGTSMGGFAIDSSGRISFSTLDAEYSVEPMPPLVGEVTLADLFARQPIYERRARAYQPDPAMVTKLAGLAQDVEVVAFFGTWCQTCKAHLPALLSAIEHTGNPHLKLRLIALDESASEPADWIEACGAGYVTPTFVVRIDGEEIGRIEEAPAVTIEADLVAILTNGR